MFVACSTNTFRFNSNVGNVELALWDGEALLETCQTPCTLDIEHGSSVWVSVGEDAAIYPKPYSTDGVPWDGSIDLGDWFQVLAFDDMDPDNWGMEPLVAVTSLPLFLPTYTSENLAAIRYDSNAYYIYVGSADEFYIMSDTDYVYYALTNFDQMQLELFVAEQPFIETFTEITGLQATQIADMLLASDNALAFLDTVTLELVKKILETDETNREKIAQLSELLNHAEFELRELYFGSNEEILQHIDGYLRQKRGDMEASFLDAQALNELVKAGKIDEVASALKMGIANPNAKVNGYPVLFNAAQHSLEMLDIFIAAGANINARYYWAEKTVYNICANDDSWYCLEDTGRGILSAPPELSLDESQIALDAYTHTAQIVRLLDAGIKIVPSSIDPRYNNKDNDIIVDYLFKSIEDDSNPSLQQIFLATIGTDPQSAAAKYHRSYHSERGRLLTAAVHKGSAWHVKALLEIGAEDGFFRSAYKYAKENGYDEIADMLEAAEEK
jgi:hypothetical protein